MRHLTISLAVFASLTLLAPSGIAQDALGVEFHFSQSSLNCTLSRTMNLAEFVDDVHIFGGDTRDRCDSFESSTFVVTVISSDRSTITIPTLDGDYINSPVTVSGAFDLGFDGLVPYSVTVTDLTGRFPPFSAPLDVDLSFQELDGVPVEISMTGTVEIGGQISPFSFTTTQGSTGRVNARLSVNADLSQITLDFFGYESSLAASSGGLIFSGSVGTPHHLELRLGTNVTNGPGQETSTPTVLLDSDGDGVPDLIDNCQAVPNDSQSDTDNDGVGDACNDAEDFDGDEFADNLDNCRDDPNPGQEDVDGDGIGDACDPFPNDDNNRAAQCEMDRDQALADLAACEAVPAFVDSDGDGEEDSTDICPNTPVAVAVDGNGCSLEQFCTSIDTSTKAGERTCKSSDWQNDEAITSPKDCVLLRQGRGQPPLCVPAS